MSKPQVVIDSIGGNCPVQADGTINEAEFYFRARGETWRLSVAESSKGPYGDDAFHVQHEWPGGPYMAGWMTEEEATLCIEKGALEYIASIDERRNSNQGRPHER